MKTLALDPDEHKHLLFVSTAIVIGVVLILYAVPALAQAPVWNPKWSASDRPFTVVVSCTLGPGLSIPLIGCFNGGSVIEIYVKDSARPSGVTKTYGMADLALQHMGESGIHRFDLPGEFKLSATNSAQGTGHVPCNTCKLSLLVHDNQANKIIFYKETGYGGLLTAKNSP